ncbi:hypothetical protein [Streptosporangium canum]|uniref:hypothetical protein n=1 Tax=Streptosporangium canum TaxID=324952 RepID=UPI001C42EEC5|nr:hypothetical protein [Streptosporangium canum]
MGAVAQLAVALSLTAAAALVATAMGGPDRVIDAPISERSMGEPAELPEVQVVNAVAPFLLIDRLLPLLLTAPFPCRYIVNMSAVEGQFVVPRVYDPIVRGEAGDPVQGVFLKDYAEAPW